MKARAAPALHSTTDRARTQVRIRRGATFSSTRSGLVVPGIGTTSTPVTMPWASTQASASWAAVTPLVLASSSTRSTSRRFLARFSPWKRGLWRRQSSSARSAT